MLALEKISHGCTLNISDNPDITVLNMRAKTVVARECPKLVEVGPAFESDCLHVDYPERLKAARPFKSPVDYVPKPLLSEKAPSSAELVKMASDILAAAESTDAKMALPDNGGESPAQIHGRARRDFP